MAFNDSHADPFQMITIKIKLMSDLVLIEG